MSEDWPVRRICGIRWRRIVRRASQPRDQGGFVLVLVLGLTVFFAIVSIALLQMTQTTAKVAERLPNAMKLVRQADSALDIVVNKVRSTATPPVCSFTDILADPPPPIPDPEPERTELRRQLGSNGVDSVTCVSNPTPQADRRDLTISIYGHTPTKPLGQVRLVIDDAVPSPVLGEPATHATGYLMAVCDWQVGEVVSSTTNDCEPVS